MKFSERLKVFQLNILRQAGVMVTPDQLGLKRDPIAEAQAQSMNSPFSAVLNRMGGLQGVGQAPVPPAPPADPNDTEAVSKYQQEVMAYQQSFQVYNQRFMQLMLHQMNSMQQAMLQAQQQASGNNNSSSLASNNVSLGVGGILGGDS